MAADHTTRRMPPHPHVQLCIVFSHLLERNEEQCYIEGQSYDTVFTLLSGTPWLPYQTVMKRGSPLTGLGTPHLAENHFPSILATWKQKPLQSLSTSGAVTCIATHLKARKDVWARVGGAVRPHAVGEGLLRTPGATSSGGVPSPGVAGGPAGVGQPKALTVDLDPVGVAVAGVGVGGTLELVGGGSGAWGDGIGGRAPGSCREVGGLQKGGTVSGGGVCNV